MKLCSSFYLPPYVLHSEHLAPYVLLPCISPFINPQFWTYILMAEVRAKEQFYVEYSVHVTSSFFDSRIGYTGPIRQKQEVDTAIIKLRLNYKNLLALRKQFLSFIPF